MELEICMTALLELADNTWLLIMIDSYMYLQYFKLVTTTVDKVLAVAFCWVFS